MFSDRTGPGIMTNEEHIAKMLELLKRQKPSEEHIDRMHAKTEGELEHLVPSNAASIAIITPDGEVGLDELYDKHKKQQDEKVKVIDKVRHFKVRLRRRW